MTVIRINYKEGYTIQWPIKFHIVRKTFITNCEYKIYLYVYGCKNNKMFLTRTKIVFVTNFALKTNLSTGEISFN